MGKQILIVSALWICSFAIHASSLISVDSVNYPVWVQRDNQSIPLAPGDELLQGDIVQTGSSGRAWLSMNDGTVVKLGQATQFAVREIGYQQQQDESVLKAAIDVVKGAFRLTTGFFTPKRQTAHQVDARIGAITVGIRGTDIWGRAGDDQDFVALLEGIIDVFSGDEPSVRMDQPLSLYLKPKDQPAAPVQSVAEEKVAELGQQTELVSELGIASINGTYDLVLMSLQDEALVDSIIQRFHEAGYAVKTERFSFNDTQYTRLILQGFVDKQAAQNLRGRISDEFLLQDVWVKKRSF